MSGCRIVSVSRFKIVRVYDCQGVGLSELGLSGCRIIRV